ncbi:YqhG family protein [Bacillus horti]|uniref:YqhG n=1 Tax=Caldalkalibacillus horti TaxID=77523 RepID=A0ABT9W0Y7_9BACI|nr:YqhG family protein [Bacillus horti]MDQ0166915.1 hypothetical protein [Bacillus horti]
MNQQQLYNYVEAFLHSMDCQIINQDQTYLTTQLTPEVDKQIMNRPYYWMFVERTGATPQPAQLTFVFDNDHVPDEVRGELLKFGCWRLHQIFDSAKQNGQFIRLYEEVSKANLTQGLMPWLLINYKISFISDQKKDIFYPLGFNLVTGQMMTEFEGVLGQYRLTPKIPDYHFTFRPIFSLASSIQHIEKHIQEFLHHQDTTWATQANQRLDEEIDLIKSFYFPNSRNLKQQPTDFFGKLKQNKRPDQLETEKEEEYSREALLNKRLAEVEQYRPRIEVNPINVGLVYLQTDPQTKIRLN